MNIFYLDKSPTKSAQAMTDKHVVKMVLESAQLLSTAHRVLDGTPTIKLSKSGARLKKYDHPLPLYKSTHVNHPSAIWVRESVDNYKWLYDHFVALSLEYSARFSKVHKSYKDLGEILKLYPTNIPDVPATPIRLAIADSKYHKSDPVESYRSYYVGEKIKTEKDLTRYLEVLKEK